MKELNPIRMAVNCDQRLEFCTVKRGTCLIRLPNLFLPSLDVELCLDEKLHNLRLEYSIFPKDRLAKHNGSHHDV